MNVSQSYKMVWPDSRHWNLSPFSTLVIYFVSRLETEKLEASGFDLESGQYDEIHGECDSDSEEEEELLVENRNLPIYFYAE